MTSFLLISKNLLWDKNSIPGFIIITLDFQIIKWEITHNFQYLYSWANFLTYDGINI